MRFATRTRESRRGDHYALIGGSSYRFNGASQEGHDTSGHCYDHVSDDSPTRIPNVAMTRLNIGIGM